MIAQPAIFHDPPPPLHMLLWQQCWGVAAGSGTGSMVSLHFGRKLPRGRVINNRKLSGDLKTHQGEAILFIECRWSLSLKGEVLFASDSDGDSRRMADALRSLVGQTVTRIDLALPLGALALTFASGALLELEADEQDPGDSHDNFTFTFGERSFVVGSDLGLRIEPRPGALAGLPCPPSKPNKRKSVAARGTGRAIKHTKA